MEEEYMKRAIELAKKGRGYVSPNPLVGAVIVKDGKIIGEGYHKHYGGNHAEIEAIKNSKCDLSGADIYVTLEPCSHYGKTPPCANEIVKHKFKRVFIGTKDINPLVAGRGIKILEDSKIEVHCGICENECIKLNEVFFKYIKTKEPFVIMKTAMTLDGKIATKSGKSKWITNEKSREYVHKIRSSVKAIMVGINTVIADNPKLTSRIENGKNPIKIIIDSNLRIPKYSNVLDTSTSRCIVVVCEDINETEKLEYLKSKNIEIIKCGFGKVDLKKLMGILGDMGIDSILLEGGGEINFSALKQNIVDKAIIFVAPKIFGGKEAKTPVMGEGIEDVSEAFELYDVTYKNIYDSKCNSNDIAIVGYLKR